MSKWVKWYQQVSLLLFFLIGLCVCICTHTYTYLHMVFPEIKYINVHKYIIKYIYMVKSHTFACNCMNLTDV